MAPECNANRFHFSVPLSLFIALHWLCAGVSAHAGENIKAYLIGRAIFMTFAATECRIITTNGGAAQPERCEGGYRLKARIRIRGNKVFSDVIEFERFGNALGKTSSNENNGTIYFIGESIDLIKREDLSNSWTRLPDTNYKKLIVSASLKGNTLTLSQDSSYVQEINVLGASYDMETSEQSRFGIVIKNGQCQILDMPGNKSSGVARAKSVGILVGALVQEMKVERRLKSIESSCTVETE